MLVGETKKQILPVVGIEPGSGVFEMTALRLGHSNTVETVWIWKGAH